MTERKLATVRKIDAIDTIPDADNIDVATVGGWKVVVKKGDFQVNDLVLYFEIDSWVPAIIAPFLNKGRTYNGVEGERLRTKKLRGVVSQGLILPLTVAFYEQEVAEMCYDGSPYPITEGDDVTELLSIQKWEKELSANLAGVARGNFPSFIRKTDQERIQNLKRDFDRWKQNSILWEVTEKLDGSSMTVYFNDGVFGVCSRNLDLIETEGNSFWQAANEKDLRNAMNAYGKNIAFQGELAGEGIQGNKLGLKGIHYFIFDIFDIDKQEYLGFEERSEIVSKFNLLHAPVLGEYVGIKLNTTIEDILSGADGMSLIGNKSAREGLVYKSYDGKHSFKIVSNRWLLKNEEK